MRNLIIILIISTLAACFGIPSDILKSKSAEYQFPVDLNGQTTVAYFISPVAYQEPQAYQQIIINVSDNKLYYGSYNSAKLNIDTLVKYRFGHKSKSVGAGKWNQLRIKANKPEIFFVLDSGLLVEITKEQAVTEIVSIEYFYCQYKPKPCKPMVYHAI